MKEQLNIIKVGGKIVEEESSLVALLSDFALLPGRKVLVHGGGSSATAMATRLGIETRMVDGRRVTDGAMLEVVTMVYAGLVNKRVVARLGALGVKALGLTGADMDIIRSHRRSGTQVDYGFVGDVDRVNADALALLIEDGTVPVIAPLTHDGQGQLLNTNADTMAGETAKALAGRYDVTLTFCFEKAGVLRDADDESSVIPFINKEQFRQLVAEGIVSGGMIPKLENAFDAIQKGVCQVIITHSDNLDGTRGTAIK